MAGDYLVDRSTATILGAVGLLILFVTWKSRSGKLEPIAPVGWVLTGFYFFNDIGFYLAHDDVVLVVMSAITLPGACAIAVWERQVSEGKSANALRWFRGTVAVAGLPYLMIAHIPMLNVLAIWFVAWQSAALLSFAGGAEVTLGDTYANPANGASINWNDWDGNRWFLTEEMSEYSFHTELLVNGEPISVMEISKKYNKKELGVRYNKLLSDLYELRAWKSQIDLLREENIELKRSLNFVEFKRKQSQKLVAARVINRPSSTWWKTFVIDRGSDDGVKLNDPVMTPVAVDRAENVEGALVGKIVNVSTSQSTVVLVTDSECKIGAYVHGVFANANEKGLERVQGILSGAPGAGRDVNYLVLQNLPKEADRFGVSAGAKVYSSGVGNAEVS